MGLFSRKSGPSLEESLKSAKEKRDFNLPSAFIAEPDNKYMTRGIVTDVIYNDSFYLVMFDTGAFAWSNISGVTYIEDMYEIALLRKAKADKKPVTVRGNIHEMKRGAFQGDDEHRLKVTNAQRYGIAIDDIEL